MDKTKKRQVRWVSDAAERGDPVPTLEEFKANLPQIKWTIE